MTTIQRSNRSSKISIWGIVLIAGLAVLTAGGGYIYLRLNSQTPASTSTGNTLQTAKATTGDLVLFAKGTGTVSPAAESKIGFNIGGQVSSVAVNIGEHVETGQVLAQLDDTYVKIDLAQAQAAMNKLTSAAAIATAQQLLADAQTSFVNAKKTLEYLSSPEVLYWEEKVIEREQTLADAKAANQTDKSETANKKVTDAETTLIYAQDSLTYFQKMYTKEYIPATFTQYQTIRGPFGTRTEVIKVEDTYTGQLINLVYPPTVGEIGMARSTYDLAKASISEAQTYLDVINGAEIPDGATGANLVSYIQTKHALETAEYNLKATKLVAPISGTISALNISAGNLATKGSSVITISDLEQPYVLDAYIEAKDWGQIQIGYEVEAAFDIIPDQTFKGTVINVYPTLDTASSNTALVHFTARLNDPISYELPAGSSTSVKVIGGTATNAVLVPIEALHEFGDGKYALFVMANGKLQFHPVQVGLKDLTKAEIVSGLSAGDIVTTGVVKTK